MTQIVTRYRYTTGTTTTTVFTPISMIWPTAVPEEPTEQSIKRLLDNLMIIGDPARLEVAYYWLDWFDRELKGAKWSVAR